MNTQIHSGKLDGFKYQQVVDLISEQLDQGSLRPGDRLPSLRHLSGKLKVSVPTVRQAYLELERQGQISARPKSGYFIEARRKNPLVSGRCIDCKPVEVDCRDLIDQVYDAIHQPDDRRVVGLRIALNLVADDLGWNEEGGQDATG